MILRDWTFKFSHNQPFQKDDERHNWPPALYHKKCKCNWNFAGYDCKKCEFGYYDNDCTQKKALTRKNFLKLSAEEKDQYIRYINMSRHYISDYVVTLTPYSGEVNKTVKSNRDPTALFHNVSNYDLFVRMHYYAARDTNITWQGQILRLRMTGRGFLRGIDCTCWLGEKNVAGN